MTERLAVKWEDPFKARWTSLCGCIPVTRDISCSSLQSFSQSFLFFFLFVWKHQSTAMSKTSEQLLVLENFIGGKFVPCRSHIDSYDPSTGEVYCKVPDSGEEEVGHPVLLYFLSCRTIHSVFSLQKFLLRMKAGARNCFFCCDSSAATHP